MGVMNCSRKKCDNIMCNTYIDDIGYICYECKSEFEDFVRESDMVAKTKNQIETLLIVFMATKKNSFGSEKMTIGEYFSERTRL